MLKESILQYFQPSLFKLSFVFKTFVLSIFEWSLKTDFTVNKWLRNESTKDNGQDVYLT